MSKYTMKNKLENCLLLFAATIFLILLAQAVFQTGFNWVLDFKFASKLGTTLAGILSFVSVVLIFINLKKQSYTFSVSQIENRFFELIKFHRDNVKEMEYESPESSNKEQINIKSGHKVFVTIYYEILLSQTYLDNFLKIFLNGNKFSTVYKNDQIEKQRREKIDFKNRIFKFEALEKVNIAYLVVFVGVSKQGREVLKSILEQFYSQQFVNALIQHYASIPVLWSMHRKKFEQDGGNLPNAKFVKYFGGHQHRLGHYFRHLYQAITYIDNSKQLNFDEKYEYIKSLRAQLSTYEQAVVFFNSISDFGRVWELEKQKENDQLVTKYNFIKNIPAEFITDIDLKQFYPLVEYEGLGEIPEKVELKKKYT